MFINSRSSNRGPLQISFQQLPFANRAKQNITMIAEHSVLSHSIWLVVQKNKVETGKSIYFFRDMWISASFSEKNQVYKNWQKYTSVLPLVARLPNCMHACAADALPHSRLEIMTSSITLFLIQLKKAIKNSVSPKSLFLFFTLVSRQAPRGS